MMKIFKVTSLGVSMFELTLMHAVAAWVVVFGPDTARLVAALYKVAAGIYNWGGSL